MTFDIGSENIVKQLLGLVYMGTQPLCSSSVASSLYLFEQKSRLLTREIKDCVPLFVCAQMGT